MPLSGVHAIPVKMSKLSTNVNLSARRLARYARAAIFSALKVPAARIQEWSGRGGLVLMYHRVLPAEQAAELCVETGMNITPESFRKQLSWLAKEFDLIPLSDLVQGLADHRPLPLRACALTFDDGWLDNYENAFPSLREYEAPATIFLVTDRVGTLGGFWPDDVSRTIAALTSRQTTEMFRSLGLRLDAVSNRGEALIQKLKEMSRSDRDGMIAQLRELADRSSQQRRELLDWQEVREMAEHGISFESHGRTHRYLPELTSAQLEDELRGSLAVLRQRGLAKGKILAYPAGMLGTREIDAARAAGYVAAVTTRAQPALKGAPLMEIPRIGLHEDVAATRPELRYTLSRFKLNSGAAAKSCAE